MFKPNHLHVPTPLFFFCSSVCVCLCVHRLVAKPCAHILQIQEGVPRQAHPNAVLERLYQSDAVRKKKKKKHNKTLFALELTPCSCTHCMRLCTHGHTPARALTMCSVTKIHVLDFVGFFLLTLEEKESFNNSPVMSCVQCPDRRQLEGLSKQLDWDERKIQRWFRVRRNQDRPSMQTKFCESM